tara:strand:- start:475 stop:1125 length:651 start_codon:yes stop_codon:yes gene_type:complete
MGTNVFLDLDGTLTDPKIGITKSIRYSMAKIGSPLPKGYDLDWTIGPSLWYSFKELGLEANDTDKAINYYRERYTDIGLFENYVYEGISEALQMLKENNIIMHLMTSKPHIYARKITAHFNLSKFLTHEFGSELDGKNTNKADLIREALHYLKLPPHEAIMVGDRKFDIIGAKENSIRTIAVLWGYGSEYELKAELPNVLIETPKNLAKTILKMDN